MQRGGPTLVVCTPTATVPCRRRLLCCFRFFGSLLSHSLCCLLCSGRLLQQRHNFAMPFGLGHAERRVAMVIFCQNFSLEFQHILITAKLAADSLATAQCNGELPFGPPSCTRPASFSSNFRTWSLSTDVHAAIMGGGGMRVGAHTGALVLASKLVRSPYVWRRPSCPQQAAARAAAGAERDLKVASCAVWSSPGSRRYSQYAHGALSTQRRASHRKEKLSVRTRPVIGEDRQRSIAQECCDYYT